MLNKIVIILLYVMNSAIICGETTSIQGVDSGYFGGNFAQIDYQAARGKLQLATTSGPNDSFDVAGKNLWQGLYTWLDVGRIQLSPPMSSQIFSSSSPWEASFDFESKVELFSEYSTRAGLFVHGANAMTGIWIQRNFSGDSIRIFTDVSNVTGSFDNGVHLRIKKVGGIVSRYYRQSKDSPWIHAASNTPTGSSHAIALGHPDPGGSSSVRAIYSEFKVRPFIPIGTWNSNPIDLTVAPSTIGNISWKQDLPAGTRMEIQTSTSQDGSSWSAWSAPYADYRGSSISSPSARYIRVAATLHADPTGQNSPVLDEVRIEYPDATPFGPLITPLSHPQALWSTGTAVSLQWAMPAGNPAPESTYTYWLRHNGALTATASGNVPGLPGQAHALSVPLPAEGLYTLDLEVRGDLHSGALSAAAQAYSFGYDATPPSMVDIGSPTHPPLLFTNNRNPVFTLSAGDAHSGVSGYAAVLDKAPTGDPGTVVNSGPDLRMANVDNGTWYLHARAIDKAGNAGPVTHYGIRVDFNGELITPDFVKALPNPVRGDQARLEYELAAPALDVTLEFLNSQGELLHSVQGSKTVGKNYYHWDLGSLANGVYLFRVKARSAEDGKNYSVVRKVAVIR
jgi:hypothetical protein